MKYIKKSITFRETYNSFDNCVKFTWNGSAFAIEGGYVWKYVLSEAASKNVIVVGGGTSVLIISRTIAMSVTEEFTVCRLPRRLNARRRPRPCSPRL